MAVLVQRMIAADASGVMFTPQQAGDPTRIEASWGLGLSVVGGTVTPDTYEAQPDGSIAHTVGSKKTRIDLDVKQGSVTTRTVAADQQQARALHDRVVTTLSELGSRIAEILGGPQDVEWAVADGTVWVLQARPITARLPAARTSTPPRSSQALQGTPGAHGVVTGGARIVRGPSDFHTVWHSPLPRAVDTARELDLFLGGSTTVAEATELVDHVPYVPAPEETPPSWVPFFDGYDPAEAAAGHKIARSLTARFAQAPEQDDDVHDLFITHAYPIAWLIRDALDAPPTRWLGLSSANTALTVIEYRPGTFPSISMFNDMSHLPPRTPLDRFPLNAPPVDTLNGSHCAARLSRRFPATQAMDGCHGGAVVRTSLMRRLMREVVAGVKGGVIPFHGNGAAARQRQR